MATAGRWLDAEEWSSGRSVVAIIAAAGLRWRICAAAVMDMAAPEIAAALGYASVSSVSRSIRHVEANRAYRQTLRELEGRLEQSEGNLNH